MTLLQRSPSYIISLPGVDPLSRVLGHVLPKAAVHRMSRRLMIAIQRGLYIACRRWPHAMRRLLMAQMRLYALLREIDPNGLYRSGAPMSGADDQPDELMSLSLRDSPRLLRSASEAGTHD